MNEAAPAESDCLPGAPHPRYCGHLYGQRAAQEKFLSAARSGRILHAWLVTGPSGVGKATLTWKIAQFLMVRASNGQDAKRDDAETLEFDPDHPAARRIRALSEPGLSLVRRPYDPIRKRHKAQITVEEIRALGDQFALAPPGGQPLVAIIDSADDMNSYASNALLKLLEEPPKNAYLFLISHSPARLLPTIRSRCGFLRCQPLGAQDLKLAVEATGVVESANARSLAELADGSVGAAVQLQTNGGAEIYRQLVTVLASLPGLPRDQAFTLASECAGFGAAAARYLATLASVLMFLSRLARTAAGIDLAEAVAGEKQCHSRLGRPGSAETWASLHADLADKSNHAMLVNLDPVSVVLDVLFSIDKAATAAAR